jgi:hypothetical protein
LAETGGKPSLEILLGAPSKENEANWESEDEMWGIGKKLKLRDGDGDASDEER